MEVFCEPVEKPFDDDTIAAEPPVPVVPVPPAPLLLVVPVLWHAAARAAAAVATKSKPAHEGRRSEVILPLYGTNRCRATSSGLDPRDRFVA